MAQKAKIKLTITPVDLAHDDYRWETICNNLRHELKEIEDISISIPAPDEVPIGAKGEPITIGAFILAMSAAPAVIKLVECLNNWIKNLGRRKFTVTLILDDKKITAGATGYSETAVQRMVESVAGQLNK